MEKDSETVHIHLQVHTSLQNDIVEGPSLSTPVILVWHMIKLNK